MKINQDTFKEGRLFFGMRDSQQRIDLLKWRTEKFTELFIDRYPEIYLKLIGDRRTLIRFLNKFKYKSNFKYIHHLATSIIDSELESVSSNEFDILIRRFKNHLYHNSKETIKSIQESIQ